MAVCGLDAAIWLQRCGGSSEAAAHCERGAVVTLRQTGGGGFEAAANGRRSRNKYGSPAEAKRERICVVVAAVRGQSGGSAAVRTRRRGEKTMEMWQSYRGSAARVQQRCAGSTAEGAAIVLTRQDVMERPDKSLVSRQPNGATREWAQTSCAEGNSERRP